MSTQMDSDSASSVVDTLAIASSIVASVAASGTAAIEVSRIDTTCQC